MNAPPLHCFLIVLQALTRERNSFLDYTIYTYESKESLDSIGLK